MFDSLHPVAAVLDPVDATVRAVVDWRALLPGGPRPAAASAVQIWGDDVWVQPDGDGPLGLVRGTGLVGAAWTRGTVLAAAGPGQAWCLPTGGTAGVVLPPDGSPPPPPPGGHLVRVDAGLSARFVGVAGPATAAVAEPDGLAVCVQAVPAVSVDPTPEWSSRSLARAWYSPVQRWPDGPDGGG